MENEEKTKKKSKKIWAILIPLIVIIVVAICVGIYMLYTGHKSGTNNKATNNEEKIGYISSLEKDDIIKLEDNSSEIVDSELLITFKKNTSKEEAKRIFDTLKKEHKKARHIPYAYKIDQDIKKSDDKEPSGTSGMPILNIIEKNSLNHVLIVVVRYFGGIKLGAGGLIRAYGNAAKEVIK